MKFFKIHWKKFIIFALISGIIYITIGTYLSRKSSSIKFNPKTAKEVEVKRGDISKELVLTGKIDAESYANLQFQTSGMLSWVGVREGDRVKKGQAIASLDKAQLKKQLEKQMNNYLATRSNFEDVQDNYKETKERFLLTDEIRRILDRTQYSLNSSVIDVELSDLALKYSTLVSPINGVVTNINQPHSGINITPTTATYTIIDPGSIYFSSDIDEEEVTTVKVGQSVSVFLDAYPDKTVVSSIGSISFIPIQGESSTIYKIKIPLLLDNADLSYRLGMNGDARIKQAEVKNTLLLPIEALSEENDQIFVLVKNPETQQIEKKIVKTGIENDDLIEILEGLNEGQKVIYDSKV